VRGRLNKGSRDAFKNTRHITQHLVVPEPQHPVIMIGKPFVANDIAQTVRVLSAVYLDNKTGFATDKIDRVRTNGLLPDKFVAIEPARPESKPERRFRVGSGSSQSPSSSGPDLIGFSHVEAPPHPDHRFAMIRPLPARGERLAQRRPT
jgi:hypothetical protein